MLESRSKVAASHLARSAYLYVRQSTLRQVFENSESTQRQYALRERAVALGWKSECVMVIDKDLGRSGATADREGFQHLVAEVSLGRAGIVLGLEVSRLARNNADWHRLLEICSLTDTLILDEDGLYNPSEFNDRLLLGLKGTMSEAELHVLKARLLGGLLNKARRGELKTPLPVGLVYDPLDRVQLDPDAQVRQSLRLLFETFEQTGSAGATVRSFAASELQFPSRPRSGPAKGKLVWRPLTHWRTLQVLHNPRYAGAFAYGRRRSRRMPDGSVLSVKAERKDWIALHPEQHPGYITWERFETNQRVLARNARAHGSDRRKSPPREGPALLQGLALCGVCGTRMGVRYHVRQGRRVPDYVCQREGIAKAEGHCQHIPGAGIDRAVGELLLERMTPVALEVALQVQAELERREEEAKAWRALQVQRAREEADLARRRYEQVDPANRLVASVLEGEWNARLMALEEAQREYERKRAEDRQRLGQQQRERVLALATDFPRLWNDPATPDRERKRMVRLLIEDVTLTRGEQIALGVRLRGGATEQLEIPPELPVWKRYRTPPELVDEIDVLLEEHTDGAIAEILNRRGRRRLKGGGTFGAKHVQRIRRTCKLTSRRERLLAGGLLPLQEMARRLGISVSTVKAWRKRGRLTGHVCDGRGSCLYEWPDQPPVKSKGGRPRSTKMEGAR
ncbi:MAG: recombinase family protein [Bryobacterales bacterium]|nr:recombinase family protein [Bryobacterales bacterium]